MEGSVPIEIGGVSCFGSWRILTSLLRKLDDAVEHDGGYHELVP